MSIEIQQIKKGDGKSFPRRGDLVTVHYVGTLASNGNKFDSSRDRGRPFKFKFRMGEVIQGWDDGVAEMSVGERSKITVPPELGYGNRDVGAIPANSTLIFDIELIAAGPPTFKMMMVDALW
eukprot:CAMPEP_0114249044 /NCGR_PEP_ID=MMETSP0058-20121206/13914_1 /TAXON_ID=36894 /ORGANISM="Pyramimonas parkeae, CCMP726" /LENGTH=121 /DNA_ID=CAMNT_0001362527 /DNA_START=100 /DNA_END=462 /DNA_ORIENTATION=-